MATIVNDVMYLPIGCSCINQFQLDDKFGTAAYDSQLFDWSITQPSATFEILRRREPFFDVSGDIALLGPGIPYARKMPGYFLWHLDKILKTGPVPIHDLDALAPHLARLYERHRYQIRKLFELAAAEVRCIWSNVQPNLKRAVEAHGLDYSDFRLTAERYRAIESAVEAAGWKNCSTWFVTRPDDVDVSLLGRPNVVVIDAGRSSDYRGTSGLFEPLWNQIDRGGPG